MKYLIYISLSLFSLNIFSQERSEMIKDTTRYFHFINGENAYKSKDYKTAEQAYLLSDSVEHSFESMLNIGNALLMQDSTANAITTFNDALTLAKDKKDRALIHHNIGNCHLKDKAYDKSVTAFKSALRNDPTNEETRYNLAYAKKMLENQNQDGEGQSQDQQENQENEDKKDSDNKDKGNKDKKDEDKKDKEDKDKEDKDKEDKDKKEGDNDKDKDKKDGDNKEKDKKPSEEEQKKEQEKQKQEKAAAENMLDALEQEEQDKRKGMRLKEEKGTPKQIEKDW